MAVRSTAAATEDASQVPCITAQLLRRGVDERTVRGVLGGNIHRLLASTIG